MFSELNAVLAIPLLALTFPSVPPSIEMVLPWYVKPLPSLLVGVLFLLQTLWFGALVFAVLMMTP